MTDLAHRLLDEAESAVITKLADAWNAYNVLPEEHGDDKVEFRHAIHAAMAKVWLRPARRNHNRWSAADD